MPIILKLKSDQFKTVFGCKFCFFIFHATRQPPSPGTDVDQKVELYKPEKGRADVRRFRWQNRNVDVLAVYIVLYIYKP